MTAEKDIVNLWLNKKGFFTINNIKENNRDIGILALKIDKGHISKIWHVQVSCSVTGTTKDIEKNFNDKAVARKINEILTNSIGDKTDYVKIVVLSAKPPKAMEGINHLLFDDILYDVFSELDTQYYNDPNIRGMQLVKHLLLSNPRILAKLVSKSGLLSSFGKDEFIRSVMTNDKSKRFVMKLEASAVSPSPAIESVVLQKTLI